MKAQPVEKLVHEHLFPRARATDPDNFLAFVNRHLLGEVRAETQAFYGHLDTQESKYPGLDYNHRIHRIRLSRYPWHRRLFRAFDALGLTPAEISNLTRWEGTKWAKEKYEEEQGVKIRDTLSDGFPTWDDDLGRAVYAGAGEDNEDDDDEAGGTGGNELAEGEHAGGQGQEQANNHMDEDDDEDDDGDDDHQPADGQVDGDESELRSVGVELNNRLRAGVARRAAGDTNAVLDEEWEQWLKQIVDSGLLHENMSDQAFHQFFESTIIPAGLLPGNVTAAAVAGRWSEVPEYLHNLLRRTLQADLRLPGAGESGTATTTQVAADLAPGA